MRELREWYYSLYTGARILVILFVLVWIVAALLWVTHTPTYREGAKKPIVLYVKPT